jgi:hypothetical protein
LNISQEKNHKKKNNKKKEEKKMQSAERHTLDRSVFRAFRWWAEGRPMSTTLEGLKDDMAAVFAAVQILALSVIATLIVIGLLMYYKVDGAIIQAPVGIICAAIAIKRKAQGSQLLALIGIVLFSAYTTWVGFAAAIEHPWGTLIWSLTGSAHLMVTAMYLQFARYGQSLKQAAE